jgi:hypothetical protein
MLFYYQNLIAAVRVHYKQRYEQVVYKGGLEGQQIAWQGEQPPPPPKLQSALQQQFV